MPYPFLSDEWLEQARRIGVPFGDKDIDAHIDTSDGELAIDTGHLEAADLKVIADYDTAKAILIEGNPQAGIQAFMAGKVRVEGDMAKLMTLMTAPAGGDSNAAEFASRIKEITE
jgi:putative sterol carrier protein